MVSSLNDSIVLPALNQWIDQADRYRNTRRLLLKKLGFRSSRDGMLIQIGDNLLNWFDSCRIGEILIYLFFLLIALPTVIAIISSLQSGGDIGLHFIESSKYIIPTIGALLAYFTWRRNTRSDIVDHALKRKEYANQMISQNSLLLLPLVQRAFTIDESKRRMQLDIQNQTIINMYVFAEIDNLEYVFEKSRINIIDDEYALRAIKIFVARAENREFATIASELIEKGRYNHDFILAIQTLLVLGQWRRSSNLTEVPRFFPLDGV